MITDYTKKVLVDIKADTAQARQELAKLERQQKQNKQATDEMRLAWERQNAATRAHIEGVEASNVKLAGWAKTAGTVGIALEGINIGLEVARAGWQAFDEHAQQAGGSAQETADRFREASKQWDEAMNNVLVFVGEFVAKNADLVSSLADTANAIVDIANAVKEIPGLAGVLQNKWARAAATANPLGVYDELSGNKDYRGQAVVDPSKVKWADPYPETASGGGGSDGYESAHFGKGGNGWSAERIKKLSDSDLVALSKQDSDPFLAFVAQNELYRRRWGKKKGKGTPPPGTYDLVDEQRRKGVTAEDDGSYYGAMGWGGGTGYDASAGGEYGLSVQAQDAAIAQSYAANEAQKASDARDAAKEKRRSRITAIFGDPSEIDAIGAAYNALGDSFKVVTGAMQASFSAWVSGAASAKEALKSFVGQALQGIASSMFARAVEHGAMAIGALALHDPKSAAFHGKAAAANAAGAIVVGGLARVYGSATAGGAAPSAGAGAPTVTGPISGSGGGSNITIINGDGWGDESPTMRARKMSRMISQAKRYADEDRYVVNA